MIRLWINGTECDVPQDIQIEFTYKTTDADGLEAQCSNYSTNFALPRTATNVGVFTPLFDIRTVFGSASFDIHASAPAIMDVNGRSLRGYVKMESVDNDYHVRFINGLGLLLEALRTTKLSDLSLVNIPTNIPLAWSQSYRDVYTGGGIYNIYACYTFFPAFSEDENRYDLYAFHVTADGQTVSEEFPSTYYDGAQWQKSKLALTHIQAKAYNRSSLRAAVQMQYLFRVIMNQSGFTADFTTGFFQDSNPYWKNLYMTLRRRVGTVDEPVSQNAADWLPEMTCEEFILGYCKLFGLRIVVDGTKVKFLLRAEYYQTATSFDISPGVDRKVGITVSPNPYHETNYACGLDLEGTDDATYGRALKNAVNIYDGLPFKYADMMKYVGPRVYWTYYPLEQIYKSSSLPMGSVTLPYLSSDEGGELLFRFDNYALEGNGIIFNNDDLNDPYDGITSIGTKVLSVPTITAINDAAPLYAERSEMRYNYSHKVTTADQHFFADFFKPYFDEICSGDNVVIDLEGNYDPYTMQRLADCRQIVKVDNVRCRVLECVTNFVDKCRLRLQKINTVSNLVAGQGFTGYYLKGLNNETKPYVYIPSDATIGDFFDMPIDTNDTIVSITHSAGTYFTVNDTGFTVRASLASLPVQTTVGSITSAYTMKHFLVNIFTAHGLSIGVHLFVYKRERAVGYYPEEFALKGQGIKTNIRPTMMEKPDGAILALYDENGSPWSGSAKADITLRQDGLLSVTPKVASIAYGELECIVVAKMQASAVFYAMSFVIDFTL